MRSVNTPRQDAIDRAQRCADTINGHVVATFGQCVGKWAAVRLSDGGSDGVIYDTKADAIRHQVHETQCAYVCIPREGMDRRAALVYLEFSEGLYRAGARLADPDRQIQMPTRVEQHPGLIRAVKRGRLD